MLGATRNRQAAREAQARHVRVGNRDDVGWPWLRVHGFDDRGGRGTDCRRRDRHRRGADLGSPRERTAAYHGEGAATQSNLPWDPGHLDDDRTEAGAADARNPQHLDRSAVATGNRIEYAVRLAGNT